MWVCVEERVGEISHFAKIRRRIVFESVFSLSQGRIPEIGDEVTYYDNCNVHRATFLCSSETRNFTPKDLIANLLNSEEDLRLFASSNGIGEPQTQTIVELTLDVFLYLLAKFENSRAHCQTDFETLHEQEESRTASSTTDFDVPVIEMIQGADELVAVKSTLAVQEERTCTDDELDATELDSMEIPELESAPVNGDSEQIENIQLGININDFIKLEPDAEYISPSSAQSQFNSKPAKLHKSSPPKKLKKKINPPITANELENMVLDNFLSTDCNLPSFKNSKLQKLGTSPESGERPFPCHECKKYNSISL
ncbi:unnamed protein product [Oikopleura dioica]|uniref:Uncharacterized protein n=1 Tax=Oikopleura dioica TaxID=34765 RepID=E4XBH2_OIKDI|nr:unnamed protein product [Oikopleura dioica]CBY33761.1 unnamed protein product [Oikopleura dioica]